MAASKQSNPVQKKVVAIVGGGPGGLVLARLLQRKGVVVSVYERDASPAARVQGAIVDLHFESGLKVLEEAGLLAAFKASYMPGADKYRIVDKHGTICLDEHAGNAAADFGDEQFRPEIDRGALRNLLLAALHPGTVVWNSQFAHLMPTAGKWQLVFKNGTTAVADIVIGADGARSKIRPYVTAIEPQYAGVTIIQGEVEHPAQDCPAMHKLINGANLLVLGDGKSLSIQPRGDGGLTFYASAKYPEDWLKTAGLDFNDSAAVQAYLVDFLAGWNPLFFTLFKACAAFIPRPLKYVPLNQTWPAQPNLTLIGNAAHLMPPSGEGVNTAMLDALDLSNYLTSNDFADTQAAIAAYETHMRARGAHLAQEALEGTETLYTPDALTELVQMFQQIRG